MIDEKMLKSLESKIEEPSYSVIISELKQRDFCNKNEIDVCVQQFSPNLEQIIQNNENIIETLKDLLEENDIEIPDLNEIKVNSCVQKTLTIESLLDYNKKDGLFVSGLSGSIDNGVNKNIISRYIEGKILKKDIKITDFDYPNFFNKTKFRIKNNNLVIKIPDRIDTFVLNISENDDENTRSYTEGDVNGDSITIPLDNEKYTFSIRYSTKKPLFSHDIENITTQLQSKIELDFEYNYKDIPAIILTIDSNDKLYKSYETSFVTNEDNEYSGVVITFNGLKRQRNYGDINITVIGNGVDKNDSPDEG